MTGKLSEREEMRDGRHGRIVPECLGRQKQEAGEAMPALGGGESAGRTILSLPKVPKPSLQCIRSLLPSCMTRKKETCCGACCRSIAGCLNGWGGRRARSAKDRAIQAVLSTSPTPTQHAHKPAITGARLEIKNFAYECPFLRSEPRKLSQAVVARH